MRVVLFVLAATLGVGAQAVDDGWLSWSAARAEGIGKAAYVKGRVGGFFDMRVLKTERSYNYKLAATWLTPDVTSVPAGDLRPPRRPPSPAASRLLTGRDEGQGARAGRTKVPRKPRVLESEQVYHVYNRRTDCQLLFPSPPAFDNFLHLMEEGRERYDVRICSYCVMDTHWHQAIWVRDTAGVTMVARYLRWLSACHAIRFRYASDTRGHGHVYQDRYKSKRVRDEHHYITLLRYIEANPLVAGLVERAEYWPWSSLAERLNGRRKILHDGPIPLLHNWVDAVNKRSALEETEDYPVDKGDRG